ncbi:MAG TPA: Uma2 family endonuclease [Isosphaeraceae bacterium]|jgi:Uma2 family endonuclease|nr:Uma2 family endonuclease [Isosphaeraceae bacterium]
MAAGTSTPPNAPPLEPEGLYEVIDGQVVEKRPMSILENVIAARLIRWLIRFDPTDQRGQFVFETLFLLDPAKNLRRRPDLAFVSAERWPLDRPVDRSNAWDVVPDLAIEVISPTNITDEDMAKVEDHFRAGTRLVWLVFPGQQKVYSYDSPTQVRILQVDDELDGRDVLPGLQIPLAELFQTGQAKI